MGYQKFKELEFVYEYDFATDGGAASGISLRPIGNAMDDSLVLVGVDVYVETAFDDAGNTATVTLGPSGGDADGYLVDFMTLAETANTAIRSGDLAGALLWDDTNDHETNYRLSTDTLAQPVMTIGTEALTQGKAHFVFKCKRYV